MNIQRSTQLGIFIIAALLFCILGAFVVGYLMAGTTITPAAYAQEPSEPTPAATLEPTPEPTEEPILNMGMESGIDGLVICEVDIEEFETFITLAGAHDDCADPVEWAEITIDWEGDIVTWNETVLVNRTLFEFGRWVQP